MPLRYNITDSIGAYSLNNKEYYIFFHHTRLVVPNPKRLNAYYLVRKSFASYPLTANALSHASEYIIQAETMSYQKSEKPQNASIPAGLQRLLEQDYVIRSVQLE